LSRRLAAPKHRDGESTAKAEAMKIKILENIQIVKPFWWTGRQMRNEFLPQCFNGPS
jgi:hypothetical protein